MAGKQLISGSPQLLVSQTRCVEAHQHLRRGEDMKRGRPGAVAVADLHLGTQLRDAGREISLHRGALPQASSVFLAAQLLGRLTTPSAAAGRAELQIRVQEALNSMEALDRGSSCVGSV